MCKGPFFENESFLFFQFHAVFEKFWQNRMLAPPGQLAPPPRGNPGSATGHFENDNVRMYRNHLSIRTWIEKKSYPEYDDC